MEVKIYIFLRVKESSTMTIKGVCCFETLVTHLQITGRHSPEYGNLNIIRRETFRSYT
jgi:hypothetical protein